jgi:ketosteroid isomerase-like protein
MKKITAFIFLTTTIVFQNAAQQTTTPPQPDQVVREFLFAVQQHDREKVKSLLHPQVQWKQPGNNRLSGTKRSADEVMEMGHIMGEWSERTLRLASIDECGTNGNTVAVRLRWTAAQPTGKVLDVGNVDIYTVANGKITHVTIYSEDIFQEDRFWGK